MELLRSCLFFYLLPILLSLSISSTTNSDPTNAETVHWKGGDGAKRSRVRRQNLHLQHALRLPEKAYAFYMLWRLVNEIYNDTNTIKPLMTRPDKTEFMTSERPKKMEIEDEPSSAPIQEQSTHSTGMTGTNDSTAMASFPTEPSSLDSKKTTQLEDLQLVEQSTQQLQTTIQKITEPSQVVEQHIPDSTTFKIPTIAAEEPSTTAIHEQTDRFTGINGTNNSTTMVSFPTDSLPDSQETTQSGDSQLPEESTQHFQTTIQKMTEHSQVIEQHIPDSTTFKTTASFPTDSLPDSQETTQSGDSQQQHIPDSTKFTIKISSKAAEEPSLITTHEQIEHSSSFTDTKNSTAMASFPIQSSLSDSQKTTQSADSELAEESTQRFHRTEQKIPEPIIHSIETNYTNYSTAIMSFPTDLPPQELQKNTQSGAQLLEHSTQHFQSPKQKMTEPSQRILQPTALMSIPHLATTYRIQQETPLQSAIDPHILASTMENDNLQPTPPPQMTKKEYPKTTLFINGMGQSISKPTPPARTKQITLLTVKPEIIKNPPHTLSVTRQNGKPNWLVTATDWRVSKPTSLLLTEDSLISELSEPTSDPEHHKPKPTKEPTNQHTEKTTTNTAKPSRDSLMQTFMTTNTQKPTNDSLVSSKTASTSPLPTLMNDLVNSDGPEDTSVPTGNSLQDFTSFRTYWSNAKTQSQSTKNKYTTLGKTTSHASFLLVKDTSTQAPRDGVRSSQSILVSTEKLIMMFTPNPRPSEKHIHTTSVVKNGLIKTRTQEIPNIQPTKTAESRPDSTNQGPTADSMPKENSTSNDLLTETDKPMQSMSGRKPSTTTTTRLHVSKTRTVSQKPKTFILPTHKSVNTAIEDDNKTHRDIFVLLFTFGCLMLLIIVILLRVVWRRWQARHWRNNMWVAGPPLLWGTYHSVLQNSSSHTAIQMRKENSQRRKQENSDVCETIALKQQHKDLV